MYWLFRQIIYKSYYCPRINWSSSFCSQWCIGKPVVREEFIFINNLASSFTGKLKGQIIFTTTFLEEMFVKFLSNWEKKWCNQHGEYARRGKTHDKELCSCHVDFQTDPMNHNQVLLPQLYFKYSRMHMPVTIKHNIQFPHFSGTKKAVYRALLKEQRITYFKTNKWPSKMSQYCITSMASACITLSNEQVKIAFLPKYCACSFAMLMKINNVSTTRTRHCILRQQISSE